MVRQTKEPRIREDNIMTKGVIVRHLTFPVYLKGSKKLLKYLYKTYGDKKYNSIMNQYTPLKRVKKYTEINWCITEKEYEELVNYAMELGIEKRIIQEGGTASESFIPEFNEEGV